MTESSKETLAKINADLIKYASTLAQINTQLNTQEKEKEQYQYLVSLIRQQITAFRDPTAVTEPITDKLAKELMPEYTALTQKIDIIKTYPNTLNTYSKHLKTLNKKNSQQKEKYQQLSLSAMAIVPCAIFLVAAVPAIPLLWMAVGAPAAMFTLILLAYKTSAKIKATEKEIKKVTKILNHAPTIIEKESATMMEHLTDAKEKNEQIIEKKIDDISQLMEAQKKALQDIEQVENKKKDALQEIQRSDSPIEQTATAKVHTFSIFTPVEQSAEAKNPSTQDTPPLFTEN